MKSRGKFLLVTCVALSAMVIGPAEALAVGDPLETTACVPSWDPEQPPRCYSGRGSIDSSYEACDSAMPGDSCDPGAVLGGASAAEPSPWGEDRESPVEWADAIVGAPGDVPPVGGEATALRGAGADSRAASPTQCGGAWLCLWKDSNYLGTFKAFYGGNSTYTEAHLRNYSFDNVTTSVWDRWGAGKALLTQFSRYYERSSYPGTWICFSKGWWDNNLSDVKLANGKTINFNDKASMAKFNRDHKCWVN